MYTIGLYFKNEVYVLKTETLKDKAYSIIKSKIINCEYPPNAFLNESILMKEINASRTPIREALNKLEQENLLKIIPKKGLIVAAMTFNDIEIIYQARSLIEPFIIQTNGLKIDKERLKQIRESMQININEENRNFIYKVDNDLHQLIASSSENNYFKQMLDKIYDQNQRLRILTGQNTKNSLERTQQEHMKIINLLLEDKVIEAADAMRIHLENSKSASFTSTIKYAQLSAVR